MNLKKIIVATVLSLICVSAVAAKTCSWDNPGHNPFTGNVVESVDHYKDIPKATREKLKQRLRDRSYEDVAIIKRDTIEGKTSYDTNSIKGMHFGANGMCDTVTRAKWKDEHVERGLIYCEDGECLIVPTVCRNVSRITKNPPKVEEVETIELPNGIPFVTGKGNGNPGGIVDFPGGGIVPPNNPHWNPPIPTPLPPVAEVPEPGSIFLFLGGLGILGAVMRKKNSR